MSDDFPREKLRTQIWARVDDTTLDVIDEYMREREREARTPLSRSLVVREILEMWAQRYATRNAPSPIAAP